MSKSNGSTVLVTLAEIARLAGVGRAAVSNWRRRYKSFPAAMGGTDTSPQFSLPDIEKWLRDENKFKVPERPLERLWPEFEALGDRDAMGLLVAAVGARLSATRVEIPSPDLPKLGEVETRLLERAVAAARGEGVERTFDFLLGRWLRTHVRQVTATPEPLAALMASIASFVHDGDVRTALDPACGTGTLLLAAGRLGRGSQEVKLLGQDNEPVLAALTSARLAMAGYLPIVTASDTLRADVHAGVRADVVLCNPPSNERDWGHEELATDPRWVYGLPPRTEPELAWVQHAVASMAPGGVCVLVLPPAVAVRRAGRRIRAGLLRAGVLQAVIALPPGAAPPHSVGLHLWVLRAADTRNPRTDLVLMDAAHGLDATAGKAGIDWPRLQAGVSATLRGEQSSGSVAIPVIELLDEKVDLTPARHIPGEDAASVADLRRSWTRFGAHLDELRDIAASLSTLHPAEGHDPVSRTTVAELERAGAVEIFSGQGLPDQIVQRGERPEDTVPVLTVPGLLLPGGTEHWLPAKEVPRGMADGTVTLTASEDVIVVGVTRSFDARVDVGAPSVLGPHLYALRADPSLLDPWFLAGCLRAPSNVRQAGTHASTSSRVDVRRLQVPRLPLHEQQRYGEIYRKIAAFERELHGMNSVSSDLGRSLGDLLASGGLLSG
ncbi:N-6 DNA methylase [Streptomyces sp. NPDC006544]|uniref:N-6 DNA methylase n=1 Tax=Streptomyces sp. NPDC006544 TaxID=3154583 RepID=UPI0033BA2176